MRCPGDSKGLSQEPSGMAQGQPLLHLRNMNPGYADGWVAGISVSVGASRSSRCSSNCSRQSL